MLGELRHGDGAILLVPPGGEWREPGHEEVEPGEGHHVHRQLPQVGVQLPREPQARRHPGHRDLERM